MVSTFTFGTSLAPGVSLTQQTFDVIPAPLTNHAIAYLFVTVPGDAWDCSPEDYSPLLPVTPTPIASLANYLELIGGDIPNPVTDYPAYVSYKSVESFFANSGGSGVLYVIRTAITPQVRITLDDPGAENCTYFTIKIDGVYYGDVETGLTDGDGDPILAFQTTGIDIPDNTFDIINFLRSNELFNAAYEIIDDLPDIQNGIIYLASREFATIPTVTNFTCGTVPTGPYSSAGVAVRLTNVKELVFKLETNETVFAIDGSVFHTDYWTANSGGQYDLFPGDDDDAFTQQQVSAMINEYLEQELGLPASDFNDYSGSAGIPFKGSAYGKYYQPATDDPGLFYVAIYDNAAPYADVGPLAPDAFIRNATSRISYYVSTLGGESGTEQEWAPVADLSSVPLTPKSVQSYALNVNSPTNRVVLTSNGATPSEHSDVLYPKLNSLLNEDYYTLVQKDGVGTNPALITRGWETVVRTDDDDATPTVSAPGLFSWDLLFALQSESKISVPAYIHPGTTSAGNPETKFFTFLDDPENLAVEFATARVQDYIFTIRNGVTDLALLPGFLLCPEGFARYSTALETETAAELSDKRTAIASVLVEVARNRNWFALIDDNPDSSAAIDSSKEFNTVTGSVAAPFGHMGFYYPYVRTIENLVLPASPFVAGIAMARYTDEGFVQPPAGADYPLQGVLRPKYPLNRVQLETYSPRGMNAIITIPNSGVVVWGARTTALNTPLQFVNSRVVVNIALEALSDSFNNFPFSAIRADNNAIFTEVRNTAIGIMQNLFESGSLLGATPQDSYRVICDSSNNSNLSLSQGIVFCDIVLVPASTLERLEIRTTVTSAGQVNTVLTV